MIEISEGKTSDYEEVNKLTFRAWQVLQEGYPEDQWQTILINISNMERIVGDGTLIIAKLDGKIVGVVGYIPPGMTDMSVYKPQWASVRMLAVDPDYRNQGIGKELMLACLLMAREDNVKTMALHTSPIMEVALPMYLRMGFKKIRKIPDICGAPYDLYTMDLL